MSCRAADSRNASQALCAASRIVRAYSRTEQRRLRWMPPTAKQVSAEVVADTPRPLPAPRILQSTDSTAPNRAANAATTAAGYVYRPRGGRPAAQLQDGARFLTEDEVARVYAARGGDGLREAYRHLYKKSTGSGNLRWLRAKLTGGQVL